MGYPRRYGVECLISTVLLHHDIPIGFVRHGVLVRGPGMQQLSSINCDVGWTTDVFAFFALSLPVSCTIPLPLRRDTTSLVLSKQISLALRPEVPLAL